MLQSLVSAAAIAVLAAASGAMAEPAASPAEQVVAAERAFAATARARGITAAFLATIDEDRAVRLTPNAAPALPFWRAQPNRIGPPYLDWRPIWAGASRCGGLGFTTGPYDYAGKAWGYYFTVWRRRGADGPFKWVLDAGVDLASDPHVPADAPVVYAPAATGRWGARHGDAFTRQVLKSDAALNAALAGAPLAAYAAALADDARAIGPAPDGPAIGRAAVLAAVGLRPAILAHHLETISDACGDLAVSYGTADWTADGKTVKGDYVRVWRRAGERWRLLFDEVTTPG